MALDEILRNFPLKWLGVVIRHSIFPLGLSLRQPNDSLGHRVASLLIRPGEARDRLSDGIYLSDDPDDITGCLEDALHKVIAAEPIERRLRHEQVSKHGLESYQQWIDDLVASGQLTAEEADSLLQARLATMEVIKVDEFEPEQLTPGCPPATQERQVNKTVRKKAAVKKAATKKSTRSKAAPGKAADRKTVRKVAVRKKAGK